VGINLLVRLATVCPTDPFDGFFAWMGCSFLKAIGLNPDSMHGDLISTVLLAGPPPSTGASCSGSFLESLLGQVCVTQTLWQMTEAASYPLIVAMLAVRFGRMLANNNFSVSPGWAVADPVLRAIVAATFAHLSWGIMVEVHTVSETLSVLLFGKITSAGGVTGAWLAFPGTNPLADIVYWLYSIYIFLLFLASLIGYQICVVLAPLAIPFWVYSGQNQVFSWFAKTVAGGLVLPIALAVGWGTIVDMLHVLGVHNHVSVQGDIAAWMLEVIFITAGVWFMGKFVKATTGELFSSQNLLSTVFMSEAVLLMSSRMGRSAVGHGTMTKLSGRVLERAGRGKYTPHGLVARAQQEYSGHLGVRSAVMERVRTNEPTRFAMVPTMEGAQPGILRAGRNVVYRNAWVAAKNGNFDYASRILNGLTIDPDGGIQRGAEVVMESLGRANDKVWGASIGVASRESLGKGLGTSLSPAGVKGQGMLRDLIAEPDFQDKVGRLNEYVNEGLHHRTRRGQEPPMDAWLRS
jgi:hypothetical protein